MAAKDQEEQQRQAEFAAAALSYTHYYLALPNRITNQKHVQVAHPFQLVHAALRVHSLRQKKIVARQTFTTVATRETGGEHVGCSARARAI